jgi:hypothetical protein
VFQVPAMRHAAVYRLVHHSTIFEMNLESYRQRTLCAAQNAAGRLPENPPTQRVIPVPGMLIDRFEGLKIQSVRVLVNTLRLMQQLGAKPEGPT